MGSVLRWMVPNWPLLTRCASLSEAALAGSSMQCSSDDIALTSVACPCKPSWARSLLFGGIDRSADDEERWWADGGASTPATALTCKAFG
jgi:hypothetical protein